MANDLMIDAEGFASFTGTFESDRLSSFTYDDNDRILTKTVDDDANAEDRHTVYDWDDNGTSSTTLLGETTYLATDDQGTVETITTNEYNARGRLSQSEIDEDGNQSIETTTQFDYDNQGLRVRQTRTTGGNTETREFVFDPQNPTGYAQALEEVLIDRLEAIARPKPLLMRGSFGYNAARSRMPGDPMSNYARFIAILALCIASAASAQTLFPTPMYFSDSSVGRWVFAADFNEDGHDDVVSATSLFLGRGDGTLEAGIDTGTASNVRAVVDIDLDGHLDILGVSQDDVVVSLGNGDGTFDQSARVRITYRLHEIEVADLNNDGFLDIIALEEESSPSIGVVLGNGDGTFQSAVVYEINEGDQFPSLRVRDFTGDGIPDVLADIDGLRLLRGVGDGTLEEYIDIDVLRGINDIGVGDFDGDGVLDIAASRSSFVYLYYGEGDGEFASPEIVVVGRRAYDVVPYDLDEDGRLDLLVSDLNFDRLVVLENRGDRSFDVVQEIEIGCPPYGIAVSDFDGDRVPDLAIITSPCDSALVVRGLGPLSFETSVAYQSEPLLPVGSDVTLSDVDGDGVQDLVVVHWEMNEDFIATFFGNDDGTFGSAVASPFPDFEHVVGGDVDGDGNADVFAGTNSVALYLGNGTGEFTFTSSIGSTRELSELLWVDISGDGSNDVVFCGRSGREVVIVENDGNGGFDEPRRYPFESQVRDVAVADMNGDGINDFVAGLSQGFAVSIGLGGLEFLPPVIYPGGVGTWSIGVGDFNGDGWLDVVQMDIQEEFIAYFRGAGDGTLQHQEDIPVGPFMRDFETGDVTGDGRADVVIRDHWGLVVIHGGEDGLGPLERYGLTFTPSQGILLQDVNADGALDIVSTALGGAAVSMNRNSGEPSCDADLDGDGDVDSKDFFFYLELFAAMDDRADIDQDGDIDAEDFFAYLDLFAGGCG